MKRNSVRFPEVLMMNRYNRGYRSNYPGEIRDFYFINQVRPGRVSFPDVNEGIFN